MVTRGVVGAFGGLSACILSLGLVLCLGTRGEYSHTAAQFGLVALGVCLTTAWGAIEAIDLFTDEGIQLSPGGKNRTQSKEETDFEKGLPLQSSSRDEAIERHTNAKKALRACAEMFAIMAIVYGCDRTSLTSKGTKLQSPRAFWIVWLLLCLIAAASLKSSQRPRILSRDQTEEWKGWMQLMFLLYHYFAQAQLYNAIRVYIAAYVWMTGYGNFLYYQKTGNFSIIRVAQSLFRLNFFVILICIVLRNEYMLYYICPMHTAFTLFVWLALRIYKAGNKNIIPICLKIILTLACTYCIYDINSIFSLAFGWQPLRSLLAFHDPLHPEFTDELHEWHFRSGLDRFVWIIGMATAALLPLAERGTEFLEKFNVTSSAFLKCIAFLLCILSAMTIPWVQLVFRRDKFSYNTIHPYTSWIPITAYIIFRNILPTLRTYYLSFFAFLGRITLETYILQFHVWMRTTGLNGSPKSILLLLPDTDSTYWLNFILVSALYIFLSYRVFQLTVDLKDTLVPTEPALLYRRSALAFLGMILFYLIGRSAQALTAISSAVDTTPSLSQAFAGKSPATLLVASSSTPTNIVNP